MVVQKVAVIGAGVCGLTAIKACLEEDLDVQCFEKSAHIGGLWNYSDIVKEGQGSVMKTTITNTSKEIHAFSDFPPPPNFPNFMHHSKLLSYLHLYADHYKLKQYIHYNTSVTSIVPASDKGDGNGGWLIQTKEEKTEDIDESYFDAVLVCSGIHAVPKMPQIAGLDGFMGNVEHTHHLRETAAFEGQRLVVVGMGNSAVDAAVELSKIAKQVYLSTRRGSWVMSPIGKYGLPYDVLLQVRALQIIPSFLVNTIGEIMANGKFNHHLYNIRPKHRFTEQGVVINDQLPNCILNGSIIIKPDIACLDGSDVVFTDGSRVASVDSVISGTGYQIHYPFLDQAIFTSHEDKLDLYEMCFPVSISTMAFIGCISQSGPMLPLAEMQARWAVQVFKKKNMLPGKSIMLDVIDKRRRHIAERYVASPRYDIKEDYLPYLVKIAEKIACKPNILRMLWTDPVLALACYFGPCTAYQFRLYGPNPWPGARDAILSQWQRIQAPLNPNWTFPSSFPVNLLKRLVRLVIQAATSVSKP